MLITFLTNQRSRIIPTLSQRIRQTAPAYGDMPAEELQKRVTQGVDAFLEALRADDLAPLEQFIADTVAPRTVEEFPLALLHAAFTAFGEMLPSLLHECYGDDLANILTDLQRLHLLKDAILMRLVTQYETEAQTIFRKRQAEQRAYRAQLEEQLIQVGDEFQTLQDFNESIIQSMTSGLLVADKESHRILKVNRAMERLGGFTADAVVGKTVEEVFASYHGLPIGEFADEVERQGTIALRKHQLHTEDGREFHQYIKGQVFYNHKGEDKGVVVIVDDISKTELLRETFSRYLSPQVLEDVLSSKHRPAIHGTRRELTVLFADIRNFTRFAEIHQSEEVVEVMNQYLDVMVEVLFAYQGTLDKFLGDGLLAFFGAPLHQPDHALRAVQAALEIQRAIADFNKYRRQHGAITLEIGIGINSGEAIVGNIGSERRMEYTVIGDMVNVAQRLQTCAQPGDLLISSVTLPHVAPKVTVYDTVEEHVKGRRRPVLAHRIGPLVPSPPED
ncbi:MAG: adenylate/guanylate cyclase domain-containing protein [Candidatus Tectomicrobia bacterium]